MLFTVLLQYLCLVGRHTEQARRRIFGVGTVGGVPTSVSQNHMSWRSVGTVCTHDHENAIMMYGMPWSWPVSHAVMLLCTHVPPWQLQLPNKACKTNNTQSVKC